MQWNSNGRKPGNPGKGNLSKDEQNAVNWLVALHRVDKDFALREVSKIAKEHPQADVHNLMARFFARDIQDPIVREVAVHYMAGKGHQPDIIKFIEDVRKEYPNADAKKLSQIVHARGSTAFLQVRHTGKTSTKIQKGKKPRRRPGK